MRIWNYIFKRLLLAIPTLFGVSVLVFSMVHLIPGDPAQMMLYPRGTPEEVNALREQLGLNQPLITQYLNWAKGALTLDFGTSIETGRPVMSEIARRITATVELSAASFSIEIVLGIVLGIVAARKKNTIIDYLTVTLSLAGVSIPVFWLGLMLMMLFSATLGWLPISGRIGPDSGLEIVTGFYLLDALLIGNLGAFWDALKHIMLPAISLATIPLALIVRVSRSSMLEVFSEDYMLTAESKGIPERLIVFRHALKNALIPVVTVVGIQVATVMGGAILTETVFSWPGLGTLIINALNNRDYPVLQGVVFIAASFLIIVNILVDLLYSYLDPRIRY